MAEPTDRITVSRETLRAELSQLELRLVDRLSKDLETKADDRIVSLLADRVTSLELSRAGRDHLSGDLINLMNRTARLERFRYAVPSAAILTLAVAAVTMIYYLLK